MRNEDAAYACAALARLQGHFFPDFFDENIPLRLIGCNIVAEYDAVQRVCFHIERNIFFQDLLIGFQHKPGRGGTGEGHHILRGNMIEQVAGASADQLQGSLGQNARRDDLLYDGFGQVTGDRCGLNNRRHAGQ